MRVVVRIPESYPELAADLTQVPARARAERLRLLAALGLTALRGTGGSPLVVDKPPPDPADGQRRRLWSRLGASLGEKE